jgi:serine/threonine protein kinase
MEMIVGRDLRELLRQAHNTVGPIPVPIAIHILFQICDALDYAHNFRDDQGRALGLVHRDISPANVLIGEDGCAKVVDFGVAKGSTATLHTQSGMLKGKFAYMAPEMLQGVVDARCDLFAVGVVAWELLTAKPLFAGGDDMEILQRVTTWDPPPPSTHQPDGAAGARRLGADGAGQERRRAASSRRRRCAPASSWSRGCRRCAPPGPTSPRGSRGRSSRRRARSPRRRRRSAPRPRSPSRRPPPSGGDSVVITVERPLARGVSDSRPPTVRATPPASLPSMPPVQSPPIAAGGPAQTLLVDDGAVVASQPAPASGERKSTVMFGSGVPPRPSSPQLTPVPTPAPQLASGPVATPMPPQASSAVAIPPSAMDRTRSPSVPPAAGGPHATMIGAVVPIPVASPSGRFSATAPPPAIGPSTVPPPLVTPRAMPAQPMHTPQAVPVPSYTPQAYPAQPAPLAPQTGAHAQARTVNFDGPAWSAGPSPQATPEYQQAAAAFARGTAEPGGAPSPAPTAPLPPAPRGNGALIAVLVLGAAAAVGGFFLVQHFL